jgi:hypothetical protein
MLGGAPCHAQGGSSAQFLTLDFGARSAALGGAMTAFDSGISGGFTNPASLEHVAAREHILMQSRFLQDFNLYYLGTAHRLSDKWVLGGYLSSLDYGNLEVADRFGNRNGGTFSAGDLLLQPTVSYALFDGIVAGGAFKMIRSEIESEKAVGYAADLGVQMHRENWSVGSALQNIGRGLKFRQARSPLPLTFRMGGAVHVGAWFTGLLDFVKFRDGTPEWRLGTESRWRMGDKMGMAVRLGYRTASGVLGGMTGGFGLEYREWELGYSFTPMGEFESTHWFGLTVRGGGGKEIAVDDELDEQRAATREDVSARILSWYETEVAAGRLTVLEQQKVLRSLLRRLPEDLELRETVTSKLEAITGGSDAK